MTTKTADCGGGLTATWLDDISGPLMLAKFSSGTGVMNDYDIGGSDAPWYSSRSLLTSLVFMGGIKHIGEYAFSYCSSFTGTLTIPSTVTSVGDGAFFGCSSFTDVKFLGNKPTLGSLAFYFKSSSPAKTYDVYTNGWANATTFPEFTYTKWNYKTFETSNSYVWDGSAWKLGTPYVYISSGWKQGGDFRVHQQWLEELIGVNAPPMTTGVC